MTHHPTPARPLVAPRLAAAAALAAALLTPLGAAALQCTHLRPSGPGTQFFPDAQIAVVQAGETGREIGTLGQTPLASAASSDCAGVAIDGGFSKGGFYSGAAQATPTVVRARASNGSTGGDGAVDAVAQGALVFKVKADNPLLPKDGPLLAFHIDTDGIFGGTGSTPGIAGFKLSVNANASPEKFVEHFTDTNGHDLPQTFFSSNSPSALAKATIDFEGFFPVGDAFFTIKLEAFAQPHSFADFANTSKLSSITVLSPGYSLELPEGLFVLDPSQPGRYLIADAMPTPVPEPASALLMLAGCAILSWRRQRAGRADA